MHGPRLVRMYYNKIYEYEDSGPNPRPNLFCATIELPWRKLKDYNMEDKDYKHCCIIYILLYNTAFLDFRSVK